MLRWLPNALYRTSSERQRFLQEIVLFVLAVHVALIVVMIGASFFAGKGQKYTISLHQSGATYVLMPLQKHVTQSKVTSKSAATSRARKKSKVVDYDTYQHRKKSKKQSVAPLKQKATATIASIKSQPLSKKSRVTATMVDKKPMLRKKNKIKVVEQAVSDAVEPEIVEIPKTEPLVPTEAAAAQVTEMLETSKDESVDQTDNGEVFDEDNVIFVGYEQLDECVIGSKIQTAIQQCWTVPIGLGAGVSCQMRVVVSDQGNAQSVTIDKSSGVFVYDSSARRALLQVEYPKEVWNKTITIVLGN